MNRSKLLILTFVVTAVLYAVLQFLLSSYKDLPKALQTDITKYLTEYFRNHCIFKSAAIAGLAGMIIQTIITSIIEFPRVWKVGPIFNFMLISFLVSGILGFILQAVKRYPRLNRTHKKICPIKGVILNGAAAIIVQLVVFALYGIKDALKL